MKVIGVGNALVDILLKLKTDDTLQKMGVNKGAMDLVQEQQMRTIHQQQADLARNESPGGSVCNTMRAMARLGASVGYIGKLGTDASGKAYEEAIRKAGVTPFLVYEDGISGCSTVLISPDGERTMATFLGPAATLTAADITDQTLAQYQTIYIEGYLIANESLFLPLLERASRLGLKIALDLSNFNIVNGFKALLQEVIPQYVSILFCNESEAEAYTGLPAYEALKQIANQVDVSVVTVGKNGAWVGSKGQYFQVPAVGAAALDTTGAGDNFAAGFLYGLSKQATLQQAAQIGACLAGQVIRVIGPQIPDGDWVPLQTHVHQIMAQ